MSIFIRLSVAVTLAFLVGSVVGIEVGGQTLSQVESVSINGMVANASPGTASRKNGATRSIIGLDTLVGMDRGMTLGLFPAANVTGPVPGNVRMMAKTSRAIAPTCLVAMN